VNYFVRVGASINQIPYLNHYSVFWIVAPSGVSNTPYSASDLTNGA
jgi:hypothetical protein